MQSTFYHFLWGLFIFGEEFEITKTLIFRYFSSPKLHYIFSFLQLHMKERKKWLSRRWGWGLPVEEGEVEGLTFIFFFYFNEENKRK